MPHQPSWWQALLVLAVAFVPAALAQPPLQPTPPLPIAPSQARLDQTLRGLDGPGLALLYNEQAGILAAACEQGTIPYWSKGVALGIRVGADPPNVLRGHKGPVTALAWSGGSVLASAGVDHQVLLWSMPEGQLQRTLSVNSMVRALAMSPDGKLLASAGDDPVVQIWEVATGQPRAKLTGHSDWVWCLAFSSDGKLLASGGADGIVRLWDVAAARKVLDIAIKIPTPPKTPAKPLPTVLALTFSPDQQQHAVGGSDAQIHLMQVADGKIVRSLTGHTSSITSVRFHPSGTVLVSASKDRTLRLWNPANGQSLKVLEGHAAWVQGATFLAQGTRLASVGADQTVRLWSLTANPASP